MLHSCLLDIFLYLELQRSSDDAKASNGHHGKIKPVPLGGHNFWFLRDWQGGKDIRREKCLDLGLTVLCTTYLAFPDR